MLRASTHRMVSVILTPLARGEVDNKTLRIRAKRGMITCEEEAAANMRLTKYERPEVEETTIPEETEITNETQVEETNSMSELVSILKSDLKQEEKKAKLLELFRRNKSQ